MGKEKNSKGISDKIIYISNNPETTVSLGEKLGKLLRRGDIIAFMGDLGAGKTCFVQGIAAGLDSKSYTSSPSFSIIREYNAKMPIYHFDLYRLNSQEEIEKLGYEEYFYGNGITLIEWADRIRNYLPGELLVINIKLGEKYSKRIITFQPIGRRYKDLMEDFKKLENIGD
jgi:tRNA threonylcarbamoyladenosine biosynthesis protein TsaE